jgi:tRNA nucleotidyltransferase (CCA-adding enzyme)
MGKTPGDWDICTSALPEQTRACFIGETVLDTGLKHGTITLVLEGDSYEITTYRIDGEYSDSRHPETVAFVSDLREDLSRRDFTVNAMAYNPKTGVVDVFGGCKDVSSCVIRCVGDPDKRFQEDALRILRAIRFASVFGFSIEDSTARAMRRNKGLLKNISVERIAVELNKTLLGDGVRAVLDKHFEVVTEVIPELAPMKGFQQNNLHHCYDVWGHTLVSVEKAPKDVAVRLAMLLHDAGKPSRYTVGADGVGHFYGHAQRSAEIAQEVLTRLKYDNETTASVVSLVQNHDVGILKRPGVKRWLNRLGETLFRQLLEVKRADMAAQSEYARDRKQKELDTLVALANEVIEQGQCFTLKDLAVNGRDLIEMGVNEGKEIGVLLNRMLDLVMNEQVENKKEALMQIALGLSRCQPSVKPPNL